MILKNKHLSILSRALRISIRSRKSLSTQNVEISTKLQSKIDHRLKNLIVQVDLGRGPVSNVDNLGINSIDNLEQSIIKAADIGHVFELIRYNYREFNARHVSQLFESIDNIIKYSSDPEAIKFELLGSKEFEILANRALKVVRNFEASEALNTMIVLNNLGVSSDILLSQALMQMVRSWINDYSIDDLHRLIRFMKKQNMETTRHSLLKALNLALPHALRHRIEYKELDFYHARTLMKCIEMIGHVGVDVFGDLNLIEKCLHFLNGQLDHLQPRDWLHILSLIYEMDIRTDEPEINKTIRSLIQNCIDRIRYDHPKLMEELPSNFLVNVLLKINRSSLIYYNQFIFDLIVEEASKRMDKFGLTNLYLLCCKLGQFQYVNHRLLAFFAQQIETNPELSSAKDSPISLVSLFYLFSQTSRPNEISEDFAKLARIVIESAKFRSETSKMKMNLYYFLRNCLLLNCPIDQQIIRQWFCSEYFQKAHETLESQSKRLTFLKTMATIYDGLFIQKIINLNDDNREYVLKKIQPHVQEYRHLIENDLLRHSNQLSFEKEQIQAFVQRFYENNPVKIIRTNQVTESGSIIDLEIIDNNEKTAILLLNRRNYCRQPSILNGETIFQINSLRKQNYQPIITVELEMYRNLSELERKLLIERKLSGIDL